LHEDLSCDTIIISLQKEGTIVKRIILSATFVALALVAVWAQPKVAVLDAIIPDNMDPSVIVPVTEKIAERLVVSGRFTVLDRMNIESVLKEREFQVSGMVTDKDVVTAGQYLGADFVVVARIQKVSDTYFIAAKMIAIKTGIIANQTSAQGEGKLSALIDLAEQVGEVLSGGAVLAQSAAGGQSDISKPQPPPPPPPKPAPTPAPSAAKKNAVLLSFSYLGDSWIQTAKASGYPNYVENDSYPLFDIALGYSIPYLTADIAYGRTLSTGTGTTTDWTGSTNSTTATFNESFLAVSIFGKYPINIGSITVFPTLGFEGSFNLDLTDPSTGESIKSQFSSEVQDSFNRYLVGAGVGLDIPLGANLILEPKVIYEYKFIQSQYDKDANDFQTSNGADSSSVYEGIIKATVSVGYRL
jgi:hypothetical protein